MHLMEKKRYRIFQCDSGNSLCFLVENGELTGKECYIDHHNGMGWLSKEDIDRMHEGTNSLSQDKPNNKRNRD